MGLVSITQLANGTTADATAVDANFNNIANQLNGNLDNTNLAAGAAAANLTDASTNPSVLQDSSDRVADHVKTGTGVVAISSGLIGTFSNITYYISGKRYTASSIANKTYTANQDTYVDIDTTGTVTYTAVANNATSPALAANSIRVAKVVTGASITSITQGVAADSLGNYIYPTTATAPVSQPVMSQIPLITAKAQATSGSGFQAIAASYFYLHPSFYSVPGKTAYARFFVKASKAVNGDTYHAELFDSIASARLTGGFVASDGTGGTTVDTTINTGNPFLISAEFALPTTVKMGFMRQANQTSVTNTVTAETAFLMVYWR